MPNDTDNFCCLGVLCDLFEASGELKKLASRRTRIRWRVWRYRESLARKIAPWASLTYHEDDDRY